MSKLVSENYLKNVRKLFRYYKSLGEGAINQLSEPELHWQPSPESNNVATIVKHMVGNMRSRWTDFLTSDGEKPWRNREAEFEDTLQSMEELQQAWEGAWKIVLDVLDSLQAADLQRIVFIRNDGHTALEAINRQMVHYGYHVGQIVFLSKQIKDADWKSLSIPKGKSEAFNQILFLKNLERIKGVGILFRDKLITNLEFRSLSTSS